jgi:hypothetical protein
MMMEKEGVKGETLFFFLRRDEVVQKRRDRGLS